VVRFLANYRLARIKVVPKLKDLAIIEGKGKALKSATDYGRRCLEELSGLKAKLKLAYERLIAECEGHFDSVPDGNNFQVEQCFSRYFSRFSSTRSFRVELKS
jgi:hypothetical protein